MKMYPLYMFLSLVNINIQMHMMNNIFWIWLLNFCTWKFISYATLFCCVYEFLLAWWML